MQQIHTAISQATSLLIPRYPARQGQFTSACFWVETGKSHIQRAPKQKYFASFWDIQGNQWKQPSTEHTASIILLYQEDNPNELQYTLPKIRTLNLDLYSSTNSKLSPAQHIGIILDFVYHNPNSQNQYFPKPIFSEYQRTIINQTLHKLGHNLDAEPVLWLDKPESLVLAEQAQTNLPTLLAKHEEKLATKSLKARTTNKKLPKIYKAFTHNFGFRHIEGQHGFDSVEDFHNYWKSVYQTVINNPANANFPSAIENANKELNLYAMHAAAHQIIWDCYNTNTEVDIGAALEAIQIPMDWIRNYLSMWQAAVASVTKA